jgi:asparagine synthase (glutamine-hydrolysing)
VCGIVGVVGIPADVAAVDRARDALSHRGPDDAGTWISADRRVALAHRRLSILDLSPLGRQPMANASGTVQVTYNGEIYNFAALRAELQAAGHRFASGTDTEVVIHAYEQWGDACVDRFRGMFAFGVWDATRRRLLLGRDRVGVKPLYYYDDGTTFAFASELKALEALGGLDLIVDESALYDFLTYLYVPAPKTPYRHIRKLPPAHLLAYERGHATTWRYWDPPCEATFDGSERDAAEALGALLGDAVRAHLVADVPVGALLSGGLDSTGVTALAAAAVAPAPLRTYSIGFDVAGHSELPYARRAAAAIGTAATEATLGIADAHRLAGRVAGVYDEPFADTSAVPTLAVCELAGRDVKVALSGDGGDEVFAGYGWYRRHAARARFAGVPRWLRARVPAAVERGALMRVPGVPTVVDGVRDELARHAVIMGGYTREQKAAVLAPGVFARFDGYDDYWHFRRYWREDLDVVTRFQYLDLMTYLPDDILVKVDRAAMAVGLEVRPPLLDHHVVEFALSLPAGMRHDGVTGKRVLKAALRGLVPDEIVDRPKRGFSIPPAWQADLAGVAPVGPGRDANRSNAGDVATGMLRSWIEGAPGGAPAMLRG